MEPKVVQRCLIESKGLQGRGETQWLYSEKYAHYKQSGSGNNWALGYANYTEKEMDSMHSKIRSLLENIDYFGGF
jgi:hypothetical protein